MKIHFLLLCLFVALLTGCVTTKDPDGTVTRRADARTIRSLADCALRIYLQLQGLPFAQ